MTRINTTSLTAAAIAASAREFIANGYVEGFQVRAFQRALNALSGKVTLWWEDLEVMKVTIQNLPSWGNMDWEGLKAFPMPLRVRLLSMFDYWTEGGSIPGGLPGVPEEDEMFTQRKRAYARARRAGVGVEDALQAALWRVDDAETRLNTRAYLALMGWLAALPGCTSWVLPEVAGDPAAYTAGFHLGFWRNEILAVIETATGEPVVTVRNRANHLYGRKAVDMEALYRAARKAA